MGKKYYRKSRRSLPKEGYLGAVCRMWPVLAVAAVVPLIIRQYEYETHLTEYGWFDTRAINYDFFLASKSLVLTLLMFVMAGCVCVRLWKEKTKIPFMKLLIPLFAYGALALLSACFSVNHTFSFSGSFEQFETVWVLLGYVLIVYYIFLYAREESELRVVTDGLCFSATIIGILGTLQGLGIDFLTSKITQKLITTDEFLDAIGGELSSQFSEGQAMATLCNPNYLGVYGSMMLPFLAMLFLYEKCKWRRIWHGIDFMLVTVAVLSSRSRAGLIAAAVALCVAAVLSVKRLVKYWYLTIPAVNFAVVLLLLVNAYNDNLIFDRLKNIFAPDKVSVTEYTAEDGSVIRKTGLTELYTTEENVVFTYNEVKTELYLYAENGYYGFYAYTDGDTQIDLVKAENEDIFSFEHPALADVKLKPSFLGDIPGFTLVAEGDWIFLYNSEKGKYQYVTIYEDEYGMPVFKESDMIMADSFGFENRYSMFSQRGFLWSRCLPLLADNLILGSGPDTFVLEYPQNDYLMMKKSGFYYQFLTKPHSMYLQTGIQTGVLSLLCLLVFYGWYAIWSLRLYCFKNVTTLTEGFGVAAFVASIGYMISGLSNDSMVVTAPVFWVIMGIGIAANRIVAGLRKRQTEKTEQEM